MKIECIYCRTEIESYPHTCGSQTMEELTGISAIEAGEIALRTVADHLNTLGLSMQTLKNALALEDSKQLSNFVSDCCGSTITESYVLECDDCTFSCEADTPQKFQSRL